MPRPDWVNVRSDLSPQGAGYIMLDKANLQSSFSIPQLTWTQFTGTFIPASGAIPKYTKDSFGMVHVQGTFYNNGATATGPTLATLPAGFRPYGGSSLSVQLAFPAYVDTSSTNSVWSYVRVTPTGEIRLRNSVTEPFFGGGTCHIGHFSFYAEN